jgi:hypothetical protein
MSHDDHRMWYHKWPTMSQYCEDDVKMWIGYNCDRCGLVADGECPYGGWHSQEQAKYVVPSEVRVAMGGSR